MTRIHDYEVNKISECNLLHDIINRHKHNKRLNSRYYPILHVCMNTRHVRAKFKNLRIILDSVCIPTIVMGSLFEK